MPEPSSLEAASINQDLTTEVSSDPIEQLLEVFAEFVGDHAAGSLDRADEEYEKILIGMVKQYGLEVTREKINAIDGEGGKYYSLRDALLMLLTKIEEMHLADAA